MNALFNFLKSKLTKNKTEWTIYLYLNNQCVAKQRVPESFNPMTNFYIVNLKHCKHLIGTNRKTQVILQFYKYKLTNEEKREAHIETTFWEGVSTINEQ